jgi:hypothetical protein
LFLLILLIATSSVLVTTDSIISNNNNTYPVTDAGQTECYNSTGNPNNDDSFEIDCDLDDPYGQDGLYPGLTQRYCDNQDGTITDMNTGLIWTKKSYGPYTYADAEANQPDDDVGGGHTDFRLPTMKELYSISQFDGKTGRDEASNVPYVDMTFFEVRYGDNRYIDGQEWSTNQYVSTVMNGQTCQFGLNPIDGRIKCYPPGQEKFARYVRGADSAIGINNFEISGDDNDVVIDKKTGLEWMLYDSGYYGAGSNQDGTMDWPDALDYCESRLAVHDVLNDGMTDWRLPDAHELQSIVDYTRSPDTTDSAAIDELFYTTEIINEANQIDFGWYWTSTTHLDGASVGSQAVYVAFGRATGNHSTGPLVDKMVMDVHGAGAQRSEFKVGPNKDPYGRGPQGDMVRIYNMVRCVRGFSSPSRIAPETTSCPTLETEIETEETSTCVACTGPPLPPNAPQGVTMFTILPNSNCVSQCVPAPMQSNHEGHGWKCGVCPNKEDE